MKWYFATRSPEAVFRPLVLAGVAVLFVVVVVGGGGGGGGGGGVGMKLAAFYSVLHCRIHALLSARSKLERDFAGYFYPA